MSKDNYIKLFFLSLVSGLMAGFVSLIIASILELFFSQEKLATVFLFVFIEEMLKLGALFSMFHYKTFLPEKFLPIITAGLGIGLGFSIFETILICLKYGELPLEAVYPALIHVTTSLLLAWSLNAVSLKKASFPTLWLVNFAVIIHLCYNIFVIIST